MARGILLALAVTAVVVAAAPANADSFVADGYYIGESNGEISLVNTTTGANSLVLNTTETWLDIAWSPTGTLYGITGAGLWEISLSGGTWSFIGSTGVGGNFNSLEFASDGTLYSANYTDQRLYTINTTTGAASAVGSIGYSSAGDIAFASDGSLYMSSTANQLIEINTTTGAGSVVGAIGFNNVYGIDFVGSQMIGATFGGDLISINTTTGAGSFIATTAPLASTFGASTAPAVPEPGTLGLLGLGLATVVVVRRRRRATA